MSTNHKLSCEALKTLMLFDDRAPFCPVGDKIELAASPSSSATQLLFDQRCQRIKASLINSTDQGQGVSFTP
jgi:predicted RNA-binding Zn ribbon-like protein